MMGHSTSMLVPAVASASDLFQLNQYPQQEGQHPLTGQRAANFRLLANQ